MKIHTFSETSKFLDSRYQASTAYVGFRMCGISRHNIVTINHNKKYNEY
jgi:hypothetical protein